MNERMVRYGSAPAALAVVILTAGPSAGAVRSMQDSGVIRTADALRSAVRSADGVARFEFEARPGVWGNGRSVHFTDDERGPDRDRPPRHCEGCTNGPVRVTVRVERGVETRVDGQVGGRWRESGRDAGPVAAGAAADYLLGLVERGDRRPDTNSKEEALQAAATAAAAASGEIWPRLLGIARNRSQATDVRKAALFWTAHAAGSRAAADIEQIAVASDEETDVQEAAVFALTQLPEERGTDALLRLARENRNPDIVRTVYFWLGQRDDPRVIALFEKVLLD